MLGLLPSGHAQGKGKYRLIFMPTNDYPNAWAGEVAIKDNEWYRLDMVLTPPSSVALWMTLDMSGAPKVLVGSGKIGQAFSGNHNGPQMGAYLWGQLTDPYQVMIRDVCLGEAKRA